MAFFIDDQADVLYKIHRQSEEFESLLGFLQGPMNTFITSQVAPLAAEHDEQEVFNEKNFHALGELGFMSLPFASQYGGMEACFSYYNAGLESLAKADAGFALGVAIHGTMSDGISRFGSAALKEKYLPGLISGQKIGAFALSEANSGSDAKAMRTSWRPDGRGGYILNGTKYWITNALSADYFFVMARGEDGRVSSFIVERGWEGKFEQRKIHDKMGVRGSNTAELVFEDYHVPGANLVGDEGKGFNFAMHMLNGGRVTIASWSTGVAQGAFEKLLKYSHERSLFGKLLCDLDTVRKELSEMHVEISASRELAYNSAFFKSAGRDIAKKAAVAKVKASETAVRVSERCIELAGGYGYVKDSRIERHLRDALLARIGEGANEVLTTVVISRILLKEFEMGGPIPLW